MMRSAIAGLTLVFILGLSPKRAKVIRIVAHTRQSRANLTRLYPAAPTQQPPIQKRKSLPSTKRVMATPSVERLRNINRGRQNPGVLACTKNLRDLVTSLGEYSGPLFPETALITPLLSWLPGRNQQQQIIWRRFRNLVAYLAPEPSLISPRKHIAVITPVLLAVAAFCGRGCFSIPSHHRAKPDAWEVLRQRVSTGASRFV